MSEREIEISRPTFAIVATDQWEFRVLLKSLMLPSYVSIIRVTRVCDIRGTNLIGMIVGERHRQDLESLEAIEMEARIRISRVKITNL